VSEARIALLSSFSSEIEKIKLAEVVTLLILIQDVPGLNLVRDTDYPD
jgi:hypothetical protein